MYLLIAVILFALLFGTLVTLAALMRSSQISQQEVAFSRVKVGHPGPYVAKPSRKLARHEATA